MVHEITEESNWNQIVTRFGKFQQNTNIECASIPIVGDRNKYSKSKQILHWLEEVEKQSVILGLDYEYLFQADITECYPSIYTHSIPWAIHGRDEAKANRDDKTYLGNIIDFILRQMSFGQTNGIPQGSILMDFIAEIILGYIDMLLAEKLTTRNIISDYHIIRYRDDYRIFVNNPQLGEEILKNLTEVLMDFSMKLGSEKTRSSNNIIFSSIKPDKLDEILYAKTSNTISKELYTISALSEKFPNSGVITKRLQKLYYKIRNKKNITENHLIIISIIVTIALKNPRTYPISSAILSELINLTENNEEKKRIFEKIRNKFNTIPNTEHLDIWLQRISLKLFPDFIYQGDLCKKIADSSIEIWNCNGFNDSLTALISSMPIIDYKKIDELDSLITPDEVEIFKYSGYTY